MKQTDVDAATGSRTLTVAQFFIPDTASLQERRPRTLKHGDTFAVFDANGDAVSGQGSPEGLDDGGKRVIAGDILHLRRTRFLWNSRVFDRLAVSNYDILPRTFRLQIDFAADFSDIFEVRGDERPRRGQAHPAAVEPDAVTLSYTG